ncbi:MAG: sulfide:quinone oxidoreductase, partial [Halioglobus sp.]
MKIVKLSESVAVSEQIVATDVAQIAAAGYKVVVNNRPDDEVADQPTSDELAAAAHAVGISYYHLPITADSFPGPDSALMASLLDNTN